MKFSVLLVVATFSSKVHITGGEREREREAYGSASFLFEDILFFSLFSPSPPPSPLYYIGSTPTCMLMGRCVSVSWVPGTVETPRRSGTLSDQTCYK